MKIVYPISPNICQENFLEKESLDFFFFKFSHLQFEFNSGLIDNCCEQITQKC